jgi:cytoskeletal protein RodZ
LSEYYKTVYKEKKHGGGINMKYINKFFIVSASVALLLSACGTKEDSAQSKSNDQTENVQKDTASKSDQTSGAEKEETKKDADSSEASTKPSENQSATSETSEDEQSTSSQETKLTKSPEQDYSIQVMDGYKLTGEEPGKDALVLTSDDSQFMRIEMLSSETSMEDAAQSVKQTATAVNKNAAEKKNLEEDGIFKDSVWYEATSGDYTVNAVLVKGKKPMKLTIFTKNNKENLDKFMQMAKTIQ